MSTQFDSSIVDLDRTDELPVLDVDAYEASLASNDKNLSRMDTWTGEGLRVTEESHVTAATVSSLTSARPGVQAESLTINVERILKRITELETEINASHEASASLQQDTEALRSERAQAEQRIDALQVDKARLCEARTRSDEIAQSLKQQLIERSESIAALEKSLSTEKEISTDLSRQLAAKLMECEKAVSILDLHTRMIEDLTREGADLDQRLHHEIAASADLSARLSVAEQSLHESHSLLLEQDAVISQKGSQLAQAQAQVQNLTEERDAFRSAAAQLDVRAADLEQKDAELAQLRGELVATRAEIQSQTQLLNARTDEIDALRGKCKQHEAAILGFEHAIRVQGEQIENLMTQLRAARDERTQMSTQLDKARAREKNLTDQIFSGNNQLALLQDQLAAHTEALATIRRDVGRIGGRADTEFEEVEHVLEPVEHEGPALYLTGEVLTVGRTNDNDICIPSTRVSRCHARLLVGPTGVIIEDANSTNGCYVNGEQVRQHLLHDGDMLELGDMRYRLRTREACDRRNPEIEVHNQSFASRTAGARTANLQRTAQIIG